MSSSANCLINQPACGRQTGNPVCPKCGMDERVVYPGQADREAAQEAARQRYADAQVPHDWESLTTEQLTSFATNSDSEAQRTLGWRLIGDGQDPHKLKEGEDWLIRHITLSGRVLDEGGIGHEMVAFGYQHSSIAEHLTHASRWHMLASQRGSAFSSFTLGLMYAEGWGVLRDLTEAQRYFEIGAQQDTQGYGALRRALYGFWDGSSSFMHECRPLPCRLTMMCLLAAGRCGHVGAQFILGQVFEQGVPPPEVPLPMVSSEEVKRQYADEVERTPDLAEAAFWYRKAAQSGHAEAMLKLAKALAEGTGISANWGEAVEWGVRSALIGNVEAMLWLAESALSQQGGLSSNQAAHWLDAAVAADAGVAARAARLFESRMPASEADAFAWWMKGAIAEQKDCMFEVAARLFAGRGIPKDDISADRWIEKMLGTPRGKGDLEWASRAVNLAEDFVKGEKLPVDEVRGVAWLRKAAELEVEPISCLWLGVAYATGCGVAVNPASAQRWWLQAWKIRWVRTEIAEALLHIYRVIWEEKEHYEEARKAFERGVGKKWGLDEVGLGWLYIRGALEGGVGACYKAALSEGLYWGFVVNAEMILYAQGDISSRDRRSYAESALAEAQRSIHAMRAKGWFVGLGEYEKLEVRRAEIEAMKSPGLFSNLLGRVGKLLFA